MDNFKVALVSHEFPPFEIGGIGIHCYDLAYNLSKKRIHTVVICGKSPRLQVEKPNSHLEIVRLPYVSVPPKYFWFQIQNLKAMRKLFDECSVVHGVNPWSSAMEAEYLSRIGKPFIATCHHSALHEMKEFLCLPAKEWTLGNFSIAVMAYPLNKVLMDACFKFSEHLIVPGYSTLNYLKKSGEKLNLKKTSVIYNGVDFDKIKNATNETNQKHEERTLRHEQECLSIAFHGRLISTKGIMYLLDAFEILTKTFPNLLLNIFGRGPLEKRIKMKIHKLGLQSRVILHGYVPYDHLIKQVSMATVVVLPSVVEVGPFIAALEAMACKRPIAMFDFPFSREFIKPNETGVLAKPLDAKDLAEKIQLLLQDSELRSKIGENAYKYVRENHDWTKIVDKYIAIYREVL